MPRMMPTTEHVLVADDSAAIRRMVSLCARQGLQIAECIAEQRLLWHLRHQTSAVAAHPQDMTFDQVLTLIRRKLRGG